METNWIPVVSLGALLYTIYFIPMLIVIMKTKLNINHFTTVNAMIGHLQFITHLELSSLLSIKVGIWSRLWFVGASCMLNFITTIYLCNREWHSNIQRVTNCPDYLTFGLQEDVSVMLQRWRQTWDRLTHSTDEMEVATYLVPIEIDWLLRIESA